jgi:hypothetical protein
MDYYLNFLQIESDHYRKQAIREDKAFQEIAAGKCYKVITEGTNIPDTDEIMKGIKTTATDDTLSMYRMMLER